LQYATVKERQPFIGRAQVRRWVDIAANLFTFFSSRLKIIDMDWPRAVDEL
jgi:hypothetical protein